MPGPDPISALDKIIADAQKEGKFDDLPGKGQPLVIDTSPDAVVKGVLKEANVEYKPEWIALALEIERLLEQIDGTLEAYAAEYAADRAALEADISSPIIEVRDDRTGAPETARPWWDRLAAVFQIPAPPSPSGQRSARGRRDEAIAAFRHRWDVTLSRYASRLHESNRKIRRFNQVVPLANRQQALVPVAERLEAFMERFPRLERAEDGTWRWARGYVPPSLLAPPPEEKDEGARVRDPLQAAALHRARQFGRRPPPIG